MVADDIVGFCVDELNPFTPDQEKVPPETFAVLNVKSHLARATSGYGTSISLAPFGLKSFSYLNQIKMMPYKFSFLYGFYFYFQSLNLLK